MSTGTEGDNEENVELYIPGYVFAAVLNSSAKADNHRDGLLIGDYITKLVNAISDSESNNDVIEEEIIIQDLVANSSTFSFYDPVCEIDEQKLKSLVKDKNLVGYYKIRNDTLPNMSMREHTIMNKLFELDAFQNDKAAMLLLTPTSDDKQATHTLSYKFFICSRNRKPIPVKINIINLGSSVFQRGEYAHKSRLLGTKSDPITESMKKLQNSERDRFLSKTGSVHHTDNSFSLFHKATSLMRSMKNEVVASQEAIERCENEIKQLEIEKEDSAMNVT